MLLVAALGGFGQDPTSNANIILMLIGAAISGGFGAWLYPWLQHQFSARAMRKKAKEKQMRKLSERSGNHSR